MDDIKDKIKQALRHIWTNKYRLFLCLLTLCCLFGLVHYFKSADSATASISFNYSEAALGMNPNKTRFNAYEIVSDEVMEHSHNTMDRTKGQTKDHTSRHNIRNAKDCAIPTYGCASNKDHSRNSHRTKDHNIHPNGSFPEYG